MKWNIHWPTVAATIAIILVIGLLFGRRRK
jgi:LPXTG-motif cell wall-anchored protein